MGKSKTKTGAERESIGLKIDTSLVPFELIAAAATGLNYGAMKYSRRNYELGLTDVELLNSIDRHTRALMAGEEIDADSGLPHGVMLASATAMYTACKFRGTMAITLTDAPAVYSKDPGTPSSIADVSVLFNNIAKEAMKGRTNKTD